MRRYGRALSGCQRTGDLLAAKAQRGARQKGLQISASGVRITLFSRFHSLWSDWQSETLGQTAARARMHGLEPNSREILLLRSIEGFSFCEIGQILCITVEQAERLFDIALNQMPYRVGTRVLIIEDDAMAALEMSACLSDMACIVTGVARTAIQAVEMARLNPPNLVIASETLADGSSGLSAAREISRTAPKIRSVLVTPYPERFLTGKKPEPTFIIFQRPDLEDQVRSTVSQAFILSEAYSASNLS